jgi:hypothetical protein
VQIDDACLLGELIAERLVRLAGLVGGENVIGAALATERLA